MANSVYVYSTKTSGTTFTITKKGANDMPIIVGQVDIKGGAGIMNKNLMTPLGVATEVSGDDYAKLKEHPVFKRMEKAGFLRVREKEVNVESAVADMQHRDKSAPLVDADFTEDKAPVSSKKKKKG